MLVSTLGMTLEPHWTRGTTARGAPPPWYGLMTWGEIFTPGQLFVDLSLAVVVEQHDPHLTGVHRDFFAMELPGGANLRFRARPGDRPVLAIAKQQRLATADRLGGRCDPAKAVAELRRVDVDVLDDDRRSACCGPSVEVAGPPSIHNSHLPSFLSQWKREKRLARSATRRGPVCHRREPARRT